MVIVSFYLNGSILYFNFEKSRKLYKWSFIKKVAYKIYKLIINTTKTIII